MAIVGGIVAGISAATSAVGIVQGENNRIRSEKYLNEQEAKQAKLDKELADKKANEEAQAGMLQQRRIGRLLNPSGPRQTMLGGTAGVPTMPESTPLSAPTLGAQSGKTLLGA